MPAKQIPTWLEKYIKIKSPKIINPQNPQTMKNFQNFKNSYTQINVKKNK